MIKEICHKLKTKREELGYSIEYVVEKTKLYPSVIKNIENGRLDNIGAAYLKGFLRIYASFLEVEIGTALEEIDSSKPPPEENKRIRIVDNKVIIDRIISMIKQVSPETKKKIVLVFAGLVFLGSFFIVSRFIVGKISSIFKERSKIAELEEPAVFSPAKDAQEKKDTEKTKITEEIDGIVVSLTAKKKCFIKAVVDGKLLFEGILNKGAIETWKGVEEIEFKISNGSAVYLEVNGKPITTLTSIRKPIKSLKITPSGISVDK